ncbi:SufD family Fe-S cluster assembly protein [Thermaurantiacus sp.]
MEPTLPTKREEAWRWADLRHAEALRDVPAPANDALPEVAALRLAPDAPLLLLSGGRAIRGEAAKPAPDQAAPVHPLADFAAAVASAGLVRDIPAGTDGGVLEFLHLGTAGAAHSASRLVLGAGARLTLIETLAGSGHEHWLNHRLDVELGEGAQLLRLLLLPNGEGLVSERLFARLGPAARLSTVTLAASPSSLRTETHVALAGTGAEALVDGVLLGHGAGAIDALTRLDHQLPGTNSRQTFRLVATDAAQVSIAGGIGVARAAQQTDAEQSLKALVLRRTAAANLKPELEIFADDVRCAHGCAVGELDPAGLFYLESRGIPRAEARALLTRAFLGAALHNLPEPFLGPVEDRVAGWLGAHA